MIDAKDWVISGTQATNVSLGARQVDVHPPPTQRDNDLAPSHASHLTLADPAASGLGAGRSKREPLDSHPGPGPVVDSGENPQSLHVSSSIADPASMAGYCMGRRARDNDLASPSRGCRKSGGRWIIQAVRMRRWPTRPVAVGAVGTRH